MIALCPKTPGVYAFITKYFIAKRCSPLAELSANQKSQITDDHNKYHNHENVSNTARMSKIGHRDTKYTDAVGKMVLIGSPDVGLP